METQDSCSESISNIDSWKLELLPLFPVSDDAKFIQLFHSQFFTLATSVFSLFNIISRWFQAGKCRWTDVR